MALLPISKFPMALGMMDVAMKMSKQERLQRKKYMGLQRSLSMQNEGNDQQVSH